MKKSILFIALLALGFVSHGQVENPKPSESKTKKEKAEKPAKAPKEKKAKAEKPAKAPKEKKAKAEKPAAAPKEKKAKADKTRATKPSRSAKGGKKASLKLQHVNFNCGKSFSSFSFENAAGGTDENLGYRTGSTYNLNFGLGLGAKSLFRPEIQYSEMGAKSNFIDAPVDWKLNYLGVGVAYLYQAMSNDKFSVSPGLMFGYDYLVMGEQTVGDIRYNLNESKNLKNWDLNAGFILNSRFKVTESLHLNFEYRYSLGLNQIENDPSEKSKNKGHKALVGLSFNL